MGKEPTVGSRVTADIEGDFAVFMTGMRINNFFKVHRWLPTFWSMGGVLKAMFADQEATGALHAHAYWGNRGAVMIAYFRSIEHLERFANNKELAHSQALRDYFRRMKGNRNVGIWHESYVVRNGEYECVYTNMPSPTGLAAAGECVPVHQRGNHAAARRATGAQRAAGESGTAATVSTAATAVVDEVLAEPADTADTTDSTTS